MLRLGNICLVLGLAALATVIYQVKYEARSLDEKIVVLQRQIEEERDSLAVARAEWSLLNRPERIERLAKKYLELTPAHPQQIVILDELTESDFHRVRELAQSTKTSDAQPASYTPAAQ